MAMKKDSAHIGSFGVTGWKKRNASWIRCISIILAVVFVSQQTGWAQEGRPVWIKPGTSDMLHRSKVGLAGLEITPNIGRVSEEVAADGEETILHIQDAHASLSAQYSIVNLLDSLVADYDIGVIALEGGSGYVDTSILATLPDKDIRTGIAEFLVKEGRMSAGEFFAVTRNSSEITLYGVEDDALYRANCDSFREIARERAARVENIDMLLKQLALLEEKVYSKTLHDLTLKSREHKKGIRSFTDYWQYISALAEKNGITPSGYDELPKLFRAIKLEKSIDFEKANAERGALIDELSRVLDKEGLEKLVEGSIAFKENRVLEGVFHYNLIGLAEKAGVSPVRYANLVKFTEYMITFESIEIVGLYREFEDFEKGIREKLYRNDEERELYGMTRTVRLLKQLYGMNIDSREYARIIGSKNSINAAGCAAFIKDKCLKYGIPVMGGYDLGRIFGEVDEALKFYRDAEKRNSVMLANTVKRMRKEGKQVAALITGGFHTDGLAKLMREKKLSYFVIVPSFEEGKERPYVTILTGKKKPYEALLEAGRYQLAMELCFQSRESVQETFDELILPMLFRGIAGTLYQDESVGPFLKDWTDRYGLVEAQHRAKKPSEDSTGRVSAEKIRAFLKSGGIVWHLIKDKVVIRYTDIEGAGEAHYVIVTSDFSIDPDVPDSMKRIFAGRMEEAPTVEEKRDPGLSDKTLDGLDVDKGLIARLVKRFAETSPEEITPEKMTTMLHRLDSEIPSDLEGLIAVVKGRVQGGEKNVETSAPEPGDSTAKKQPTQTKKKDIVDDKEKTSPFSSHGGKNSGILLAIASIAGLLAKLESINAFDKVAFPVLFREIARALYQNGKVDTFLKSMKRIFDDRMKRARSSGPPDDSPAEKPAEKRQEEPDGIVDVRLKETIVSSARALIRNASPGTINAPGDIDQFQENLLQRVPNIATLDAVTSELMPVDVAATDESAVQRLKYEIAGLVNDAINARIAQLESDPRGESPAEKKDIVDDKEKTSPSSSTGGKILGFLLTIGGLTAFLAKLGIINTSKFVVDNADMIETGGGILMVVLVVSILLTSFLTACAPKSKEEPNQTPAATATVERGGMGEGVIADGGDVKVERDEGVAATEPPKPTMKRTDEPAGRGRELGIGLTPKTEERETVTGYQREEGSAVWWVKINIPEAQSQNRYGDVLFDLGDGEYNLGDKLTFRVGLTPEFGNNHLWIGLVEVDAKGNIEKWVVTSDMGWRRSREKTEWEEYSFQIPEGCDLSNLRVAVSFDVFNNPIEGKDALGVWFQLHEEPEETPAVAPVERVETGEVAVEPAVDAAGDDGKAYIGRNLIAEQTGWIPETQFDSRGCYEVERTPEGYLKVNFDIRRNDLANETSKGEVRLEFPYPQMLDLEGHSVVIEFEIDGFGAEKSSPNGVQVFTKSGNTWEGRYGAWIHVSGDGSMTAHDIIEGPEAHSAAWISPKFNPTQIKTIGLKLGTADNPSLPRTRFKGSVTIKSFTIERIDAAESAEEAPELQSIGNHLLPGPGRQNVPAVSPEDFRKNFGVSFHNYFGRYGYTFGSGSGPLDERYLREAFESLVEEGFYVVRNFLLCDLRSGVRFDGKGKPVRYNDWLVDDISNYILAGYEAGCTRLFLNVNDFQVANGTNSSDRAVSVGTITDGEYPNLFTNMEHREAYFSLIGDVLDKVYKRLDNAGVPRDFAIWGVLNEPKGVNLGVPDAFSYVQDFVRRGLEVFKELDLPIVLNSQHIDGLKYWVPLFDEGYRGEQHYHVHWYGQHGEEALENISAERLNIPPYVKIWVGEGDPNFLLALLETAYEGKIEGVLVWNDGSYVMLPQMRYGDPYDAKRAETSRERQEEARTWFRDKQGESAEESDSREASPDVAVEVSETTTILPEDMGPNPGDDEEVYLDLRWFSLPEAIPVGAENAVDLRGYKVEFVFEGMKSEDIGKFQPYVKDKAWRTRFLSRGTLYSDGTAVYTVEEGDGFNLEAIFALGYRFFRMDFDTSKGKLREIRIVPATDEGAFTPVGFLAGVKRLFAGRTAKVGVLSVALLLFSSVAAFGKGIADWTPELVNKMPLLMVVGLLIVCGGVWWVRSLLSDDDADEVVGNSFNPLQLGDKSGQAGETRIVVGIPRRNFRIIAGDDESKQHLVHSSGVTIEIELLDNENRVDMAKEFEEKLADNHGDIGMLLDVRMNSFEDFEKILGEMIREVGKNRAKIMHLEYLKAIGRDPAAQDKKLRRILKRHAWILPEMSSLELARKSIYELDAIHKTVFSTKKIELTAKARQYVETGIVAGARKFVSVEAKNAAADLRFIASALRDMGLSKEQASAFMHVRVTDSRVSSEEHLEQLIKDTGLAKYLDKSNVDRVLPMDAGDMALSEKLTRTLDMVRSRFGNDLRNNQVAIGDIGEKPLTAADDLRRLKVLLDGEGAPLYVQMVGDGIVSQLLFALVEKITGDGKIPVELGRIVKSLSGGSMNWFVFKANVEKIDFDELRRRIAIYNEIATKA